MYRIVQVLNNNVAVVHTRNNQQIIVMGKGVAFQKKKGDLVNDHKIQQVFEVKDNHTVTDLTTLMVNIPLAFISVGYKLIDQVTQKYHFSVESYIYVTLTTHLFAAYKRVLQHTESVNYLPDLSKNYPIAYKIADDILAGFKKELNVTFPDYERKSIALHFINAHPDKLTQDSLNNLKLEQNQRFINLVKDELEKFGILQTRKNDSDYDRLLIHLKYFVNRLNNAQPDTLSISTKMVAEIKEEYAPAWNIVEAIGKQAKQKLNIDLSLTEKSYMAIHIQRLLLGGIKNG